MAEPLRVALVGCGAVAERFHGPALLAAPNVTLVAAVDVLLERAERLARDHGPRVHAARTIAEVAGEVDAAIVCAPNAWHADAAVELLGRGKHVLIEKPMAVTAAECDRILVARAAAPGAVVAVGFVRRLFPAVHWLALALERGLVGTPLRAAVEEGGPYRWPVTTLSMFQPSLVGGGVLIDLGSHLLDMLLWLFDADADAEVVRYADTSLGGVEAEAAATLRVGGVETTVELSRLRPLSNTIVVEGSRGTVRIGTDLHGPCALLDAAGRVMHPPDAPKPPTPDQDLVALFVEQLERFAAAATGGRPLADGLDGRRVAALVDDCYRRRQRLPLPWLAGV